MKKINLFTYITILLAAVSINHSCRQAPGENPPANQTAIDLVELEARFNELNHQFSESFRMADSTALAAHFASDGTMGTVRGKDNLAAALGKTIRSAHAKGTPDVRFTILSLSTDGEFVIELGSYEFLTPADSVTNRGKYLVARKLEDGVWKIYRDIGL